MTMEDIVRLARQYAIENNIEPWDRVSEKKMQDGKLQEVGEVRRGMQITVENIVGLMTRGCLLRQTDFIVRVMADVRVNTSEQLNALLGNNQAELRHGTRWLHQGVACDGKTVLSVLLHHHAHLLNSYSWVNQEIYFKVRGVMKDDMPEHLFASLATHTPALLRTKASLTYTVDMCAMVRRSALKHFHFNTQVLEKMLLALSENPQLIKSLGAEAMSFGVNDKQEMNITFIAPEDPVLISDMVGALVEQALDTLKSHTMEINATQWLQHFLLDYRLPSHEDSGGVTPAAKPKI